MALADRCYYYTLYFTAVDPTAYDKTPKKDEINISIYGASGMYDMTKEERLDAMRNMLKDRPVFVRNGDHADTFIISTKYDAVFVEDINLRGLAGSLKLGKSTNDNGFGMFRTMLEYKLTSQGKTFAKIDKWYPSSKTCSVCGFVKEDLTLADRVWTCNACNTTHNRDHNAAINIRNVGLLGLYPA